MQSKKTISILLVLNISISGILLVYLVHGNQVGAEKKITTQLTDTQVVDDESATIRAIERVQPSVVSIIVKRTVIVQNPIIIFPPEILNDPFSNLGQPVPAQPQKRETTSQGTGFFITKEGLILTNKHVVGTTDAGATYTIITQGGKEYPARVAGRDPTNDLAFVQVTTSAPKNGFPIAPIGDSAKLKTGQTVMTIGNSLGRYQNTVTKGVISGIGRSITANDGTGQTEELFDIIQTDASINPGNSGGPLININGDVIGINTAIDQQGSGIGFTIPINAAKPIIQSMVTNKKIIRARIGVRFVMMTTDLAKQLKIPMMTGARVTAGKTTADAAVLPSGPGEKAGIKEGDIILEIAGEKVTTTRTIAQVLQKFNVGDTLTIKLWRDGVVHSQSLILDAVPVE